MKYGLNIVWIFVNEKKMHIFSHCAHSPKPSFLYFLLTNSRIYSDFQGNMNCVEARHRLAV